MISPRSGASGSSYRGPSALGLARYAIEIRLRPAAFAV
jgi:hypothetical protein